MTKSNKKASKKIHKTWEEFNQDQTEFLKSDLTTRSFELLTNSLKPLLKTRIFVEEQAKISNGQFEAALIKGFDEAMRIIRIYNEK